MLVYENKLFNTIFCLLIGYDHRHTISKFQGIETGYQARRQDSVTGGGAEINLGGHEKFICVNSRWTQGHEKFIPDWIK